MKVYQKPVVEIEAIVSEAVADVETLVSFEKVGIWGDLFGAKD